MVQAVALEQSSSLRDTNWPIWGLNWERCPRLSTHPLSGGTWLRLSAAPNPNKVSANRIITSERGRDDFLNIRATYQPKSGCQGIAKD